MYDFSEEDVIFGDMEYKGYHKFFPAALSCFGYIKSDLNDISKSFIRLGFHLYEFICDNHNFMSLGYDNVYAAIEANFGLSRSTVSRLVDVYKRFSVVSGYTHTMFLDDKYADYSYSQLVEMLPLSDDEMKSVNSKMTVKEIRDYKKQLKQNKKDKFQADTPDKICDVAKEDVPEAPVDPVEFVELHVSDVLLKIKYLKKSVLDSDVDAEYFAGYIAALDDLKKSILENGK